MGFFFPFKCQKAVEVFTQLHDCWRLCNYDWCMCLESEGYLPALVMQRGVCVYEGETLRATLQGFWKRRLFSILVCIYLWATNQEFLSEYFSHVDLANIFLYQKERKKEEKRKGIIIIIKTMPLTFHTDRKTRAEKVVSSSNLLSIKLFPVYVRKMKAASWNI